MLEHIEKQWLSAYLDEQLSSSQSLRVQEHLARCTVCRAYLFDLHAMQQQLKQLKAIAAPIDIRAQTLALLADLPTPKQRKRWSWLDSSAAAASIVFGLLIGNLLMPVEPERPLELAVMQVLGANPPGAVCAVSSYCYLESR